MATALFNTNLDDDYFEDNISPELNNDPAEHVFTTIVEKPVVPEAFDGNNMPVEDWIELYKIAGTANSYDDDQKLARIPRSLTGSALKCFIQWSKDTVGKGKYNEFVEYLKKYFPSESSQAASRATMNRRVQEEGESFSQYVAAKVPLIIKACPQATELEKVSYLVEGANCSLYEDLLKKDPTTVTELITVAKKLADTKAMIAARKKKPEATAFDFQAFTSSLNNYGYQQRGRTPFRGQARGRGRGGFRGRGGWSQNRRSEGDQRDRYGSRSRDSSRNSSASRGPSPFNRDTGRIQCYNCQRYGHMAKECRSARRGNFRGNRGRRVSFNLNRR